MSLGHARRRSTSSAGKNLRPLISPNDSTHNPEPDFQPCAATASLFLFAQGSTVYCLHHDTLTVERTFEKHRQPIILLSVDNISERGAGRLVVSYDVEQTAIVWDLFTGDEITRFASFKSLKVAAWMKNGDIAFGDTEGTVMLFEPATTEHKARTTINTPITAIAPAADCQTFVIGYENGSILIANLAPTFTILHTLSMPCKPSAIVGLAWHASSSKQKSDMLAVQCADGDLRVWSIAKPVVADVPKTIRVLERGDHVQGGTNWISWSKNGRIVQYSQGEAWAWDVRTKHVAYEPIPTVEGVRGIANFGPGAILFTLGPSNNVQQYDLNPPALVKTTSFDTKRPPSVQSTPRSNAYTSRSTKSTGLASNTSRKAANIPGAAPPVPLYRGIDPPKNLASLATIQRATDHMSVAEHARQMRTGMGSPLSSASRTESVSSHESGYRGYRVPSVSAASGTTFSTLSPSMIGRESAASPFWPATASVTSSGRRSRGSRLRNEVSHGPEGNVIDLFPFTRARLASLPPTPQSTSALDQTTATAEQLRRQMLEIVFGWHGDIEPMLRDELQRHPVGSTNAMLLSKWLGDIDADLMSSMPSDAVSSNDWMMLAISSMSGNGVAGQQMARTFATRLASQGDIHTAATILLGIKDHDEAVEIYVSRNYYMEAILLTCLLFPEEWQRQAFLVRRWGEYVVENSQQHLAIRCFTCTGVDNPMPWATPTQTPFQSAESVSAAQTLSPPISPPLPVERPPRMTAKNAALKLITTFGPSDKAAAFNYSNPLKLDERTPTNAPGVTPIAESAMSPGGTPNTVLRPGLRARTPSGHGRTRLSSIGETPIDVNPPAFPFPRPQPLPTPDNSGSDAEKERASKTEKSEEPKKIEDPPLTLSSARYDPSEETPNPGRTPQTAILGSEQDLDKATNSELNAMRNSQERPKARNGSRDRKPSGLHITAPSLSQLNLNAIATGSSGPTPRSGRRMSHGASSVQSGSRRLELRPDTLSPPPTGQSWTTTSSTKSPSISGRSVDAFISSIGEATFYAKQQKAKDKAHRQRSRDSNVEKKSRSKNRHHGQRDGSETRGRSDQRYIRPPKRSPSSPVPMSPDDLQKYRESQVQATDSMASRDSSPEEGPRPHSHHRRKAPSKNRSVSKYSEQSQRTNTTVRHASPDGFFQDDVRAPRSRGGSRRQSPNGLLSPVDGRGRSKSRGHGAVGRSPSSPLPLSNQAAHYRYEDDEIDEDPMRLVEANRQRMRSQPRSSSRRRTERSHSRRGEPIAEAPPARLDDLQYPTVNGHRIKESPRSSDADQGGSDSAQPKLQRNRSHRSLKKEAAARELEARRESLNMRTMGAGQPVMRQTRNARSQTDTNGLTRSPPSNWRSPDSINGFSDIAVSPAEISPPKLSPPERTSSAGPSPIGLPPTPRAMRRPVYSSAEEIVPMVPNVPEFYATGQPKVEPDRSMSCPVPEPDMSIPADIPIHPAFQRHLPRSTMKPNFHPLNEIGRHRRAGSMDATNAPFMSSIGEALEGIEESPIIDVPVIPENRPVVIPELQHLASPPPPPPPPPFSHDPTHNSLSSGSGVGTINILMDEPAPNGHATNGYVANGHVTNGHAANGHARERRSSKDKLVISPPLPHIPSPQKNDPPLSGNSMNAGYSVNNSSENIANGHRRGRSIDHIGTKIGRVADRMRSASRGRNAANGARPRDQSRDARSPPQPANTSPYETKIEIGGYF